MVIGGSGPTGAFVIDGLLERGHRVWMLHTGTHKPDRAWYDDGSLAGKIFTNAFRINELTNKIKCKVCDDREKNCVITRFVCARVRPVARCRRALSCPLQVLPRVLS